MEKAKSKSDALWTALRCVRCRRVLEHRGPVTAEDFDRECENCGSTMGTVTIYRYDTKGDKKCEPIRDGHSYGHN